MDEQYVVGRNPVLELLKNLMELSKIVNMERIDMNLPVMKESEILHALIQEGFKKAKVSKGKIIIE